MSETSSGATTAVHKRVFPLRLSPIELFMIADDQIGYPMSFVIQLQLFGQVDRTAFEGALDAALARHPLLRAKIEAGRGNVPFWVLAKEQMPDGDWGSAEAAIACRETEAIDLTQEIGLRVWVRQGAQQAKVLLQFHHACCDGTGAYRFIGDLLAAYGIRTAPAGHQPVLGPVDLQLLRVRKQRSLGIAATPARRGLLRLALAEGWKIVARQPARLTPPLLVKGGQVADFPGFLSLSLPRSEHQQLRDTATRSGVTVNDLLLRDLFLTLQRWNQPHGDGSSAQRLRIMMPTDLRSGEEYEMPAANLTGYTFLARTTRDCAQPSELLQSIRNETALIKYQRTGTAFMDMVFLASQVRWLLPFILSRDRCLATAVLSNAADPSRRFTAQFPRESGQIICGNLALEEITGVPPLRPNTRATFSISQYNRRTAISLRCDPQRFRLQDTATLLELYADRLRKSAGISDTEDANLMRAA